MRRGGLTKTQKNGQKPQDSTQQIQSRMVIAQKPKVKIQSLPKLNSGSSSDNFYTPPGPLIALLNVIQIPKDYTIWEPACGSGYICNFFSENGYVCAGSDLSGKYGFKFDFLKETWEELGWDCIVTNPPFSLKDQFLAKCYEYGKPFALLLPINAIGAGGRQKLYRENGVEIIMLGRRIHCQPNNDPNVTKGSSPKQELCWITNGFGIGQQITFYDLPKELDGSKEFSRCPLDTEK